MSPRLSEERLSSVFYDAVVNRDSIALPRFRRIVPEFRARQGRPDYVAIPRFDMPKRQRQTLAMALSTPSQAMVLSLLKPASPRTSEYLLNASGISQPVLRDALRVLETLSCAKGVGESAYVLGPVATNLELELWAFEVKIDHWQRALFQALQYRAFAHRTVVVLSESAVCRVERHKQRFRALSVGVMALNPDSNELRSIVAPRRSTPVSRFHYLYALGKLFMP